jgi:hypothetical protein
MDGTAPDPRFASQEPVERTYELELPLMPANPGDTVTSAGEPWTVHSFDFERGEEIGHTRDVFCDPITMTRSKEHGQPDYVVIPQTIGDIPHGRFDLEKAISPYELKDAMALRPQGGLLTDNPSYSTFVIELSTREGPDGSINYDGGPCSVHRIRVEDGETVRHTRLTVDPDTPLQFLPFGKGPDGTLAGFVRLNLTGAEVYPVGDFGLGKTRDEGWIVTEDEFDTRDQHGMTLVDTICEGPIWITPHQSDGDGTMVEWWVSRVPLGGA